MIINIHHSGLNWYLHWNRHIIRCILETIVIFTARLFNIVSCKKKKKKSLIVCCLETTWRSCDHRIGYQHYYNRNVYLWNLDQSHCPMYYCGVIVNVIGVGWRFSTHPLLLIASLLPLPTLPYRCFGDVTPPPPPLCHMSIFLPNLRSPMYISLPEIRSHKNTQGYHICGRLPIWQ